MNEIVIRFTKNDSDSGARGRDYQFSYYDAQIGATAKLYQIPFVFSEDFNSGHISKGFGSSIHLPLVLIL